MKYTIALNGKNYEVEVQLASPMKMEEFAAYTPVAAPAPVAEPVVAPVAAAAESAPVVTGEGEVVSSPMPGTILKVNVQNGQSVKEGDLLCVLEAMKMENEIFAPKNGVIRQVLTEKGSTVDTGAPLIVIG